MAVDESKLIVTCCGYTKLLFKTTTKVVHALYILTKTGIVGDFRQELLILVG